MLRPRGSEEGREVPNRARSRPCLTRRSRHTRAPAVRTRARELGEPSTDLRPRTSVARERRQEHASRPDDTDDLGERIPPRGDQLKDPTEIRGAERSVAERQPRRVRLARAGTASRPPAFSTSMSSIGDARSIPTTGMPASCNGRPSCPVPTPTSSTRPLVAHLPGQQVDRLPQTLGAIAARAVVVLRGAIERDRISHGRGVYGRRRAPRSGRSNAHHSATNCDSTGRARLPNRRTSHARSLPRRKTPSLVRRRPRPAVAAVLDVGEETLHRQGALATHGRQRTHPGSQPPHRATERRRIVGSQTHREREPAGLQEESPLDLSIQTGVVRDAHDERSTRPDHANGFAQHLPPSGHQVQHMSHERSVERVFTERKSRRVRNGETDPGTRERLRGRAAEHRCREVHTVDMESVLDQRQREQPGPHPHLEHAGRAAELAREQIDRGSECVRRQRLGLVVVPGSVVEGHRGLRVCFRGRALFPHRATNVAAREGPRPSRLGDVLVRINERERHDGRRPQCLAAHPPRAPYQPPCAKTVPTRTRRCAPDAATTRPR